MIIDYQSKNCTRTNERTDGMQLDVYRFDPNEVEYIIFEIASQNHPKIWFLLFMPFLACAQYVRSWVIFQNVKNTEFLLLYYSARKKSTTMVFIWDNKGYPAVQAWNLHWKCKRKHPNQYSYATSLKSPPWISHYRV